MSKINCIVLKPAGPVADDPPPETDIVPVEAVAEIYSAFVGG